MTMLPNEHHIAAQTPEELALLTQRITSLSTSVITAWEWQSLLSATETLLPRRDGKPRSPVELDLRTLNKQPRMQLFRAVLTALAHEETYKHNRRYTTGDWTGIIESFAKLSLYLVPPPVLSYGPELCTNAINDTPITGVHLANVLSRIDMRVLHQQVTRQHLSDWSDAISEELQELIGMGESINGDDNAVPDEYDDWRSNARKITSIAGDFYQWAALDPSDELPGLRSLMGTVQRPEPPEEEDTEVPTDDEKPDATYWSLERIFEDL